MLLIDDDADDLELLCEALTDIDPQIVCHTAANGQIGLDILKTPILPRPEMIFADLNMPRMDGFRFLEQVKLQGEVKHIPVIIYSTSVTHGEHEHLMAAGAAFAIEKTSSYEKLRSALLPIVLKSVVTF